MELPTTESSSPTNKRKPEEEDHQDQEEEKKLKKPNTFSFTFRKNAPVGESIDLKLYSPKEDWLVLLFENTIINPKQVTELIQEYEPKKVAFIGLINTVDMSGCTRTAKGRTHQHESLFKEIPSELEELYVDLEGWHCCGLSCYDTNIKRAQALTNIYPSLKKLVLKLYPPTIEPIFHMYEDMVLVELLNQKVIQHVEIWPNFKLDQFKTKQHQLQAIKDLGNAFFPYPAENNKLENFTIFPLTFGVPDENILETLKIERKPIKKLFIGPPFFITFENDDNEPFKINSDHEEPPTEIKHLAISIKSLFERPWGIQPKKLTFLITKHDKSTHPDFHFRCEENASAIETWIKRGLLIENIQLRIEQGESIPEWYQSTMKEFKTQEEKVPILDLEKINKTFYSNRENTFE